MDNNINILDELNKGCSMGIEAIDLILNIKNIVMKNHMK